MRWDPTEVFSDALTSTPVRLLATWIAGFLGCFLSFVINDGFDALGAIPFLLLTYPLLMMTCAFASLWGLIAIPLILVFAYKALRFPGNDNTGSDLMILFTIAYFITIQVGFQEGPILTSIIGIILLANTISIIKENIHEKKI